MLCWLLLCLAVAGAHAQLPAPLAQALQAAGVPESAVGLYVQEVGAAKPLLALNAERGFNPASTMKLVTTYAALELLGPAFTWSTELYAGGPVQDGVLAGDLIVKGYGDPQLTLEEFWLMLRSLRARGVRDIRGDLVLDRSYFAAEAADPASFDNEPTRPYNTLPDALLVNFKAVRLSFVPDAQSRSVAILPEPDHPQISIVNNLVLDQAACGDWVERIRAEASGDDNAARLAIGGAYSAQCGEKERSYSLLGQRPYFGGLFRQLWKELGGSLQGEVRDGTPPAQARLLLGHASPPLAEVVRSINKFSNNVMARQLYLTLGAQQSAPPATTAKAEQAIRAWLAGKGLDMRELVLENGAGLSRIERISARGMGELLVAAYASPVMPELISSLPLIAVDGTLKRRLKDSAIAGRAHIKGGTLAGVRAIAGYLLARSGRMTVVVCLVNHARAAEARAFQDALLQWAYGPERGGRCCK